MERRKRMRLLFYRSCRVEKEGKEEKEFPGWYLLEKKYGMHVKRSFIVQM